MKRALLAASRCAAFAATASLASPALAEAPEAAPPTGAAAWHPFAEGDVFAYTLGEGYSVHLGVRPPQAPHLRFGAAAIGGSFPSWVVAVQNPGNQGWTYREEGYSAEAFYHLRSDGSTPFIGAYLVFFRIQTTHDVDASATRYSQLLLLPAVGYRYFPLDHGLFFTAWGGLGANSPAFAVTQSGPSAFHTHTLYPFGSIHLGFEI